MTRPQNAKQTGIKTAVPMADDRQPNELKQHHVDAVVEAAIESHSHATRRAYASAWDGFVAWCEAEGYNFLPADPETVAAYLAHRASEDRAISTIKLARAAIGYVHTSHGLPNPTNSPGVTRVMRGLARRAVASGTKQGRGQAAGLTARHLAAIRATARLPRTGPSGRVEAEKTARRRGAIDIALIATMRDALLRRSEAVALTWADIEFRPDGTARLTIRRSKTDQEGEGAVQFVGAEATEDLKAIRPSKGNEAELASRTVFGLQSGRSIANRIAAAARAAGLEGRYSGHSPRVGMAMDLVASGASIAAAMIAGRWTSSRMPAHYARGETAGRGAVASFYESGRARHA